MLRILSLIGISIGLLALLPGAFADDKLIRVCDDAAEWPPYAFYEPVKEGTTNRLISGASVTALKDILEQAGYRMQIRLLPWKRCMKEVELFGTSGQFEMLANGSANPHRHNVFVATEAFYTTRPGYFYDGERYPQGIQISSIEDLNRYTICGVAGYNYAHFYQAGLKKRLDTGAHTTHQALLKMMSRRCELVLSQIEPVVGSESLGRFKLPKAIKYRALPVPQHNFHMWVSRQSPRAQKLVEIINQGLKRLRQECKYEGYYTRYLPKGSGLEPVKQCK
ncbi:substrate-binding periplasmic protein [Dongshaea marina]|uniref:substrate-binding periplasmic protein n=1 Tax=Dongshaea marina TaxID=2047966 RepID=UPI000D3EC92D|nr:ABC transporter substrate-binding protein [Dongshaea marina]